MKCSQHEFVTLRKNATVEICCHCSKWRFTKRALESRPTFQNQEASNP